VKEVCLDRKLVVNSLVAAAVAVGTGIGARAWAPQAPPYKPDKPIAIVGGC